MFMKRTIIIISVTVISLIALILFYDKKDRHVEYVQEVKIYDVTRTSNTIDHIFGGTVKNINEALLSAQINGSIESMIFIEGEEVKKGQILARIDAAEYEAQYGQTQKMVDIAIQEEKLARRKWDDYKPEEREQFKLEVARAQSQRAEAFAYLSKSRITAPFDGIISTRFVQIGDTVSQGDQIIRIIGDDTKKEVVFDVTSDISAQIAVGDMIDLSKGEKNETARVYAIDPVADERTRKSTIYAEIENPEVFDVGDFVNITIEARASVSGSVIPIEALVRFYNDTIVFVVEENHARAVVVDVLSTNRDKAVVGNIDIGQKVVISGMHLLRDGSKIRIVE
jgi:RND family efflux transporter MFP subunit